MGTACRAHDPRWPFLPTSGEGAAIHGGRFNPKGMPALYLALDLNGALREANQGFARKIEPYTICAYEIDCEDIVDLCDSPTRATLGVAESVLAAGWFAHLAKQARPPQWAMVERLVAQGLAGAIAPSYAPGATEADRNLVLWRWGPDMPHKVAVHDPSGRLPKNSLSWE